MQRNRFHASSQEARSETFRLAADLCVLGLVGPNPGTEGGNRGGSSNRSNFTYLPPWIRWVRCRGSGGAQLMLDGVVQLKESSELSR